MNKSLTFASIKIRTMERGVILNKALTGKDLSLQESLFLYDKVPLPVLFDTANRLRQKIIPGNSVSWQIDRNVNYTNVCISKCKFCTFHCTLSQKEKAFTTSESEYRLKIEELIAYGGDQLLLQGGLHPQYDIHFYENLFSTLKIIYPQIKLNALGPPEVYHIAKRSNLTIKDTLIRLRDSGLTSLPGAGAEILSDRVRNIVSPGKPGVNAWSEVIMCAHSLNIPTTATMVYGHIETIEERINHLLLIREIQNKKPKNHIGFTAFICWPMQTKGTKLSEEFVTITPSAVENLKMIAISRIVLNNIPHIQASWLTMGKDTAKLALHCGADDMGSVMMEENVVSSTGLRYTMSKEEMVRTIKEAGFDPWLRNQDYSPKHI